MPKNHHNKHKHSRFGHKLLKSSHPKHVGRLFKHLPNLKQEGKALVLAGQVVTAAGILSGQPEVAALGVGVTTGGEVLRGGRARGTRSGRHAKDGIQRNSSDVLRYPDDVAA